MVIPVLLVGHEDRLAIGEIAITCDIVRRSLGLTRFESQCLAFPRDGDTVDLKQLTLLRKNWNLYHRENGSGRL
jgi:hypothetical protein